MAYSAWLRHVQAGGLRYAVKAAWELLEPRMVVYFWNGEPYAHCSLGERGVRSGDVFSMRLVDKAAGGQELRPTSLLPGLFEAAAMKAVGKNLMAMKMDELKEVEELVLEARDEAKSGNKAWLRRRLHAKIL